MHLLKNRFPAPCRLSGALLFVGFSLVAAPATAQTEIVLSPTAAQGISGQWRIVENSTAIGGRAIRHPDAGAPKRSSALASPVDHFEMTFTAVAGTPYRLWLRGIADKNYWGNDSVFVQFDGSVTATGAAAFRIGTTSATELNLEDCSGCGLSGWMWQDNGWGRGVLGPEIYFATTGPQRMRIQTREDGLSIDQIVLSASTYRTSAPTGSAAPVPQPVGQKEIVLSPANVTVKAGQWIAVDDITAIGGRAMRHPDAGAAKRAAALANPADYFDLTFTPVAGTPYRLWLRGKADKNYWGNDSVFVQFDGSVTAAGAATYRIGTTSATEVNVEDCSGCGLSGWMWQDNGWGKGVLGPEIYFATTAPQRIRIQTREDGLSIDQIVLSSATYRTSAPTTTAQMVPTAPPPPSDTPVAPTAPVEPDPVTDPAPAPPATDTILKVFVWNIHHGTGSDGVYNLQRQVDWMAASGANVISLNEVEKFSSSWGNEDQPARYAALLQAKTGKVWHYHFAQRTGLAKGQGNLLLSTFPLEAVDSLLLSHSRSVARVQILVNGIRVNAFSTHLDADSSTRRATQMQQLTTWAAGFPEQRIHTGDFNAWPTTTEIKNMTAGHYDAWAVAAAAGTAVAFPGNEDGRTRNTRIDYVWYSKGATRLRLVGMQVYDTRNAKGIMPSDHRPIMATYEVK